MDDDPKIFKFPARPLVLPPNVVKLRAKPVPIESGEGEYWTSALDLLKELVHDIETGRVHAPEVIYVAMQTRNEKGMIAHPAYSWAVDKRNSLLQCLGLLSANIVNRSVEAR